MTDGEQTRIFGIRHHGPGSARSLRRALEGFRPDVLLVEGPPDADELLALAAHDEMKPPVAILIYDPESPRRAVFYPFAVFSPEWQAIQHGLRNGVPVRFCDLPQCHRMPCDEPAASELPATQQPPAPEARETESPPEAAAPTDPAAALRLDPLAALAAAAGFCDSERWWDHVVESRRGGGTGVFDAIADAMVELRRTTPHAGSGASADPKAPASTPPDRLEALREAWMRKTIRAARKDGFERIAVVCGAWHVPALMDADARGQAAADNAWLKGLPKARTAAAWVPWSYARLAMHSGYGAGVRSPEWYHLLWSDARHVAAEWLTRAARLMRKRDLDISPGHVIEAARLAETLAALRDRPLPGLEELDEAALSVMCFGEEPPMRLIRERLVVGERLGSVPAECPLIPLQADVQRQQKRLRLAARSVETDLDLDLRKPIDLDRSRLLHRLNLLGVPWGQRHEQTRRAKGTFHELWRVQWDPEFVVQLVEAGRWGTTLETAAAGYVADSAQGAEDLKTLTLLLENTLLADLADAVPALVRAIQEQTAVAADVPLMMEALPPLAEVLRYGNVRRTDADLVLGIIRGLAERVCIGLPNACASLDDEAAQAAFDRLTVFNAAIGLLDMADLTLEWNATLRRLAEQHGLHGLIAGRACRMLYERRELDATQTALRFSYALSRAAEPAHAAAWIEGLLAGSGQWLIHDESLWTIVDDWVRGLTDEHFNAVLPLARRTFSTFAAPERRLIGERLGRAGGAAAREAPAADFDAASADGLLPVLARILGVPWP